MVAHFYMLTRPRLYEMDEKSAISIGRICLTK